MTAHSRSPVVCVPQISPKLIVPGIKRCRLLEKLGGFAVLFLLKIGGSQVRCCLTRLPDLDGALEGLDGFCISPLLHASDAQVRVADKTTWSERDHLRIHFSSPIEFSVSQIERAQ